MKNFYKWVVKGINAACILVIFTNQAVAFSVNCYLNGLFNRSPGVTYASPTLWARSSWTEADLVIGRLNEVGMSTVVTGPGCTPLPCLGVPPITAIEGDISIRGAWDSVLRAYDRGPYTFTTLAKLYYFDPFAGRVETHEAGPCNASGIVAFLSSGGGGPRG